MHNFEDTKNYYEVLEIKTDATLQDIHTAYTRSKNAYSTDSAALYSLMSTNECERIVDQIEEAYTILGTAEKRREYDKVRGFNQSHTPEGFTEEFLSKPDYMPQNTLNAQPVENPLVAEAVKEKALKEEFKYQQEHSTKTGSTVSKIQAVNKFGLSFQKDESVEQDIENCTNYTGAFLASVREYKQVTIERMAEMTKISKTYIRNIEADEFSKLPADVYTRGFVYQYAKCLKLNSDLVATSYIHNLRMLKNPS
jgi:hypothetical protein